MNVVRATVLAVRRRAMAGDAQSGNAIVEFVYLAVLLLVPLVYVLITVFRVQAASYAVSSAAREAGRVYATSSSIDDAGRSRLRRGSDGDGGQPPVAGRRPAADHLLDRPVPATGLAGERGHDLQRRAAVGATLLLRPGTGPVHVTSSHLEVVDRYRTAAR